MKNQLDRKEQAQKNIFFYFGEDNFSLDQYVAKIIGGFVQREGEYAVVDVDFLDTTQHKEILVDMGSVPFLSAQRLFVFRNFPFSAEVNSTLLRGVDPSVVESQVFAALEGLDTLTQVIFFSNKPDKRKSGFKKLMQFAECKEFALKEDALPVFDPYAQIFSEKQRMYVFDRVGKKSYPYMYAMEKLALYAHSKPVTKEILFKLIPGTTEENSFDFVQSLCMGKAKDALEKFKILIAQGEEIMPLLGLITWQLDQLFMLKELISRGKNQAQILEMTQMKPYTYQKTKAVAEHISLERIGALLLALFDFDKRIKTGVLSLLRDDQPDVIAAFEELVITTLYSPAKQ